MNILLIKNLEVSPEVLEEMAKKQDHVIVYNGNGDPEITLIKPVDFTFKELKKYLKK